MSRIYQKVLVSSIDGTSGECKKSYGMPCVVFVAQVLFSQHYILPLHPIQAHLFLEYLGRASDIKMLGKVMRAVL